MEVIILAGGLGTRLRNVIFDIPKCMAPIADKPFLWYLLKYISRFNVDRVILSVGYLREVIFKWIDEVRDDFSFVIDYSIEKEPLGTGGGILLSLSKVCNSEAIVLNGDTFFDINLNQFYLSHINGGKPISLALKPMEDFNRYGAVVLDKHDGTILSFNEKKYYKEGLINGGAYLINKDFIIKGDYPHIFSFEADILRPLSVKRNLLGLVDYGFFIDIGIPEDYYKAQNELPKLVY